MSTQIYVTGSRNSNTGSIVSAYTLAYLLNAIVKAGLQTRLEHLGIITPEEDCEFIPVRQGEMPPDTSLLLANVSKLPDARDPHGEGKLPPERAILHMDSLGQTPRILVDHNVVSQQIPGSGPIIGVFDCHALNFQSTGTGPLVIYQRPYGSTATIVVELFNLLRVEIPAFIAQLLLGAMMMDMDMDTRGGGKVKDQEVRSKLEKITGMDATLVGGLMLREAERSGSKKEQQPPISTQQEEQTEQRASTSPVPPAPPPVAATLDPDESEIELIGKYRSGGAGSYGEWYRSLIEAQLAALPHRMVSTDITTIRDNMHGSIKLSPLVRSLVETRVFKRLKSILQLGFIKEVFPGATYPRFVHCLGAYHIACQMLEGLIEDGQMLSFSPISIIECYVAVLLHDIGHYAFSHAVDPLGRSGIIPDHEEVTVTLITTSEIAEILRAAGLSPERIARLIVPDGKLSAQEEVLRAVVSGSIFDADKLDYLPRDAQATGVPYSGIDLERLITSLMVIRINGVETIVVARRGIPAFESLIQTRILMYQNVIYNPTRRIIEEMYLYMLFAAMEAGAITAQELWQFNDSKILDECQHDDMPLVTRTFAEKIQERENLHKSACAISPNEQSFQGLMSLSISEKIHVQASLAKKLTTSLRQQISTEDILICLPTKPKDLTGPIIYSKQPARGRRTLETWEEATGLSSEYVKTRQEYNQPILLAVPQTLRKTIRQNEEVVLRAIEEALNELKTA